MRFVVTPWRDGAELLAVRAGLYQGVMLSPSLPPTSPGEDRREWAVNKVFAWRLRQSPLPLLLESTADIVYAMLQVDRRNTESNASRLLYATAIARFVTGVTDAQNDFSRSRPSWIKHGKALLPSKFLRETRHCIVHRHLPALSVLKSAAQQSLEVIWQWYWSQLDEAFSHGRLKPAVASADPTKVKTALDPILKAYVKARRTAIIKNLTLETNEANSATSTALSLYHALYPTNSQKPAILLDLLTTDTAMLPSDRKLGPSISGAFLIWTPLLTALCTCPCPCPSMSLLSLIDALMRCLVAASPYGVPADKDPVKQGMHAWLVHILTHAQWSEARMRVGNGIEGRVRVDVLSLCFTSPSVWNLKLAKSVLDEGCVIEDREAWMLVLDTAVQGDEDMGLETEEVVVAMDVDVKEGEKERRARKRLGLWRPTHIGILPVGWEDDE